MEMNTLRSLSRSGPRTPAVLLQRGRVLGFGGAEATSPSAPAVLGACHVGRYPYDPRKARQLLRQAGAEGVTVTLGSPRGRCMGDSEITQAVARDNEGRDAQERQQAYCEAQKAIWDDAPWILLHYQKLPVVTTTRVVGVTMLPNEQFDTVYARPT